MKIIKHTLAALAIALTTSLAFAPAAYSQSTTPTAPAAAPVQPAAPAFDGKALYKAAFEAWRDGHIQLETPELVEKWAKEWEHKFDNTDDLKTEEGTDKALLKMAQSFGQRFDYSFDKKATDAERQQIQSTLSGIGATLSQPGRADIVKGFAKDIKKEDALKAVAISQTNPIVVEEPMEGSPSEKAGVKPQDIIRKVDGKDVNGLQLDEAIKLIKGPAGTVVKLTIERKDDKGVSSETEISVTRASFTVKVVKLKDEKALGTPGVTYFRLNDFMSKNGLQEFNAALKKAAGGKGVIIDLRNNPGGSLPMVLTMTGMILEDGPVLITRSRVGDRIVESEITLNKNFVLRTEPSEEDPSKVEVQVGPRPKLEIPADMPVIVLVNEGSASASEILSGALQHSKRAIIVGMPTHGKGVGQSVIQLPFGRSLHVTSFEFVPGRTANDWIGVIPDVKVERGEDPKVDLQLEKAKELIVPMIKAVEDRKADRDANKKKHEEEFQKELKAREKGPDAANDEQD